MKRKLLFFKCCMAGVTLLLTGCSSTRHLKEDEYLLVQNKVTANRKELPTKGDLYYLAKPAANRQLLGVYPVKAALYQSLLPSDENSRDKKWKQWMRKNFGEEPVLLDSAAVAASCRQMQQYLYNKGYFSSEVRSEIRHRKKKAKVLYRITADECYTLNEASYEVADTNIRKIILKDKPHSLLQAGIPYDVEILSNERERIAEMMANLGFFHFTADNISYRIDSNLNSHRFNVKVVVQSGRELADSNGERIPAPLRRYYIRNIEIHARDIEEQKLHTDSLTYQRPNRQGGFHTYRLYLENGVKYKPKALVYPLIFHSGSRYSARASKGSYNRYNDMQNFRFIRISYQETEESRANPNDSGWLDCQIQLSKLENHKLDLEVLGKDIGNDYGIGANINYKNRNIFHGGEILFANLLFSTEFQRTSNRNDEEGNMPIWRYRNFEIGGETGLHFPKILFPHHHFDLRKPIRANTDISVGSYFQQRDHYSRFIANTNLK
ncbi:MAG: hypothetical protein J5792_01430, partial [Bacteroidales bacterium]|nr:hypothetical protein [Bacteroidales bacterium]